MTKSCDKIPEVAYSVVQNVANKPERNLFLKTVLQLFSGVTDKNNNEMY